MKNQIQFILATLLCFVSLDSVRGANIVIMIGEDEYKTWTTLPDFAEKDLKPLGHHVTIIHADTDDKNHFPGLVEALQDADLLLLSVRRRTPRKEQLEAVRTFLDSGKSLVGIRTASHAFALRPKETLTDSNLAVWPEFDHVVLGGNYTGHFGKDGATISYALGAGSHPILAGVAVEKMIGQGGLYKNEPLQATATPLLIGTIANEPSQPVAWLHRYGPKKAKVFYTSLGHWEDFTDISFRRLLLNAIEWGAS
ncbi:MAG: ThuA domain-containing protein [Pirellulaceae bacterium]|nr:ThuA domain-containing protein [Pirellulaceae bacterium]